MEDKEHVIELILRFRTNMDRGELDDFLCASSESLFADYRGENADGTEAYTVYEPVGSHWRDVTPYPGMASRTWDPSAINLPGGNMLGPGQDITPVPE